jgi:hypothetical protein
MRLVIHVQVMTFFTNQKPPNKPHEADAGYVCQRMSFLMLLFIVFRRAAYAGR